MQLYKLILCSSNASVKQSIHQLVTKLNSASINNVHYVLLDITSVQLNYRLNKRLTNRVISIFFNTASYVVYKRFRLFLPAGCTGRFLCLGFLWWIQDDVTTFFCLVLDAGHVLCHVIGQVSEWRGSLGKNLKKRE